VGKEVGGSETRKSSTGKREGEVANQRKPTGQRMVSCVTAVARKSEGRWSLKEITRKKKQAAPELDPRTGDSGFVGYPQKRPCVKEKKSHNLGRAEGET